jgi:farnesyl-diphosphate farnesyltransferase
MSAAGADQLIGPILQSVSRSVYVSGRLLPARLRDPVGLAYLLARATDTVADTTTIPSEIRQPHLQTLATLIQGEPSPDALKELQTSFAPLQNDPAERRLIEVLPECFKMLAVTAEPDRRDIQEVLSKINRAQILDVQRFETAQRVQSLSIANDLLEYIYLIAGCVGEFWTKICSRHLTNFAELSTDRMLQLGRQYGEGLQLINILRDAGGDLRAGRCYFPNEELENAGIEPAEILQKPARFMPVFRKWLDYAERGIKAGIEYSVAVRNRRVRLATALPALIGGRTINLLREAGEEVLEEKVKVPRAEVRQMVSRLAVTFGSKNTIQRMFRS